MNKLIKWIPWLSLALQWPHHLAAQDSLAATQHLCNCLTQQNLDLKDSIHYWLRQGAKINGSCQLIVYNLKVGDLLKQVGRKVHPGYPNAPIHLNYNERLSYSSPLFAAYPNRENVKHLIRAGADPLSPCAHCETNFFLQKISDHQDTLMLDFIKSQGTSFQGLSMFALTDLQQLLRMKHYGVKDMRTVRVTDILGKYSCPELKIFFDSLYPIKELKLSLYTYSGADPFHTIDRTCLHGLGFQYEQLTGNTDMFRSKPNYVMQLFSEGLDPNLPIPFRQNESRTYPITFDYFKESPNYEVLNYAIEKKFNINQSFYAREPQNYRMNERYFTPLGYAIVAKDTILTRYFLSKGADVNALDADGRKALHEAIELNDFDLVKELCSRGTTVNDKYYFTPSPVKYARKKYGIKPEILNYLETQSKKELKKKP